MQRVVQSFHFVELKLNHSAAIFKAIQGERVKRQSGIGWALGKEVDELLDRLRACWSARCIADGDDPRLRRTPQTSLASVTD